jgi:membrane protein insertase Oxa1/YidC/SpoIIIJ
MALTLNRPSAPLGVRNALYWLTSNLLQLAQQWWLGKRHA